MKDLLNNLITGIGIKDVLDILIVALIVYKVLGFIRETRAQQLVKGIFVLVLVFLVSDVLHLYTLNWILRRTMTLGLVALIILFQPELRRGLEYMGRGKFMMNRLNRLNKDKSKAVIDEFVKAAVRCSSTKTGVLIVIEREVSLGDIAESGTIIDAEISAQMIENVFYKGAPLHDGAAIVRGDRLFAAGCVLPLTANQDLNKDLGTRHRAGIGITENSDALTIIVSEENGVISVAKGGKLTRFLDSKGLEKLLLNLYLSHETEEKNPISFIKNVVGGKQNDQK
ncbi:MAG: diadenylate cyclase CdaA [Eubacterium sp.]|nr:diadenylate cyclase CdaA [Eubacterium sp.]